MTVSVGDEIQVYARHPSEKLILYLQSRVHEDADDDRIVRHEIANRGYPVPDEMYVAALRTHLLANMPANFDPTNQYHRPSVKFLKSQGIYGLHYPDEAAQEANALVTNLRARQIVEALILGRVKSPEISKRLKDRLGESISPDGIEAYKNYYWNADRLRVEEWALLLKNADHQRARVMAILDCGAGLALHMAGFQEQLESKQILRDMMSATHWDFQEWARQPRSEAKTRSLTALVKSAVSLDTQLTGKDAQISKAFETFEKLRLETEARNVPGIKDFAPAGNFTGSGEKVVEDEMPEEEEESEDPN